jgi:hypothetical protein
MALECIFYMSDCRYLDLQRKHDDVNSMGTENYESADFEKRTRHMTFDKKPVNLIVDRERSYTSRHKDSLLAT